VNKTHCYLFTFLNEAKIWTAKLAGFLQAVLVKFLEIRN